MPSFATDTAQVREGFARLRHSCERARASRANERKSFINHKPLGLPADEDVRQADGTLTIMAKFRYYDAAAEKPPAIMPKTAVHTEFLRTGKINRRQWLPSERRYLSYEEVADRTGKKLATAGDTTHKRINGFHASIQFPKLIFHRTLVGKPHLGYCHVTAARTAVTPSKDITWSFYFANFFSDLGDETHFFDRIQSGYSRMYFAVAIEPNTEDGQMVINRNVRDNGLLFRTDDPKVALKNVLMLGARDSALRRIIRSL